MEHTKKPWEVDNLTVYSLNKDDTNRFTCLMQNCGRNTTPQGELNANARLISAAPELLEACQEAYDYLQYNHGQGNKAFEMCKNSIKKAKGE
ncbi:MAG: hypothetical protein WC283_03810 [Candidatus Paceibacterota bacterium]|jgi:hypothetical protein